ALPAPVVTADQEGRARTAGQRTESAALEELERWAREELGYTADVEQAGARHPGRADPNPPALERAVPALPAPVVTVDGEGTARTADQRVQSEADRSDLGLTEDVERAARRHPGGRDYWREGDKFVSTDGRGDRVSWPADDATAVDR